MDRGSRHNASPDQRPPTSGPSFTIAPPPTNAGTDHETRIRSSVEDRVVRELLRIPPHPERAQRRQSGAVADQHKGASLGERLVIDALVALQRDSSEPHIEGRP